MKSFMVCVAALLALLGLQSPLKQENKLNIIFDLGDVVIETDSSASMQEINAPVITYLQNPRKIYFNYLDELCPRDPEAVAAYDDGKPLPQIMCDWLKGTSNTKIRDEIIRATATSELSKNKQKLINGMATMMFSSESFIRTRKLNKDALALIQKYKADGHAVYILSNWDADSFDLLVKKFPELFFLVDGVLTSGMVGKVKPDPALYIELLKIFGLKAEDCIFIDDQEINVKTAESLGMYGVVCPQRNILGIAHWPRIDLVKNAVDDIIAEKFPNKVPTHTSTTV